jgi:hypothetical protein
MIKLFDLTRIYLFELCYVLIIIAQFVYFDVEIDEIFVETISLYIRSFLNKFLECRKAILT